MDRVLDHPPDAVRLTNTRHGLILYRAKDIYAVPCLETYGEYSPQEAQLFRLLLKSGDVVAANIARDQQPGDGRADHPPRIQECGIQRNGDNLARSTNSETKVCCAGCKGAGAA
jgi:hypothetical protein